MSYRVFAYHKACLSLVRHGWLVVLLLGRRISSAIAISPLISRCAPETSGDISIDEVGSVNCTSSTYSNSRVEYYFTDCASRAASCISSLQPTKLCVCHGEWCRNGNESPALLKPAPGQSINAVFEYPQGSANRLKEKAATAVMPNPSK